MVSELGDLEAREEVLSYALAEWRRVAALMGGVRVAAAQAGALQAILFSDALGRIRSFQESQAREAQQRATAAMVAGPSSADQLQAAAPEDEGAAAPGEALEAAASRPQPLRQLVVAAALLRSAHGLQQSVHQLQPAYFPPICAGD